MVLAVAIGVRWCNTLLKRGKTFYGRSFGCCLSVFSSENSIRRVPIANVVCEERPAGLRLFALTFSASALVGSNYDLGPIDRPHGFQEAVFRQERVYMVRP